MTTHPINAALNQLVPPTGLADLPIWLMWRGHDRVQANGATKRLKMPYYANGRVRGAQSTPDDRAQLVTFKEAVTAAVKQNASGVGIAVLRDHNPKFVILDFDNVRQAPELDRELMAQLGGTYCERSPSGNGYHAIVRNTMPQGYHHHFQQLKSHAGDGHAFTFEVFAQSGFVTYTGENVSGVWDIGIPSQGIVDLYAARWKAQKAPVDREQLPTDALSPTGRIGLGLDCVAENVSRVKPQGREGWIQVGMAVHHETGGSEEGFDIWHKWSADDPALYVGVEDCRSQWNSFRHDADRANPITFRTVYKMVHDSGNEVAGEPAPRDVFEVADDPDPKPDRPKRVRFQSYSYAEYLDRPPVRWLIQGLLPAGDPATIFGPSGSGKSFVTFDMAMAVARGVPWQGLDTQQGRVMYVCAEGSGGFRTRMLAYATHHGLDPASLTLRVIPAAPNLLRPEDVTALVEAIEEQGGATLIVLDTLAQVMIGGDENSSEGMGAVVGAAEILTKRFNATVVLVHHTGKDVARGTRGWSGLKGAMGAQLQVWVQDGHRSLVVEKQKDGIEGTRYPFKLRPVDLGVEDGHPVSSCVVVTDHEGGAATGDDDDPWKLGPEKIRPLREAEKVVYAIICAELSRHATVSDEDVLLEAKAQGMRKDNAQRSIESILDRPGCPIEAVYPEDGSTHYRIKPAPHKAQNGAH